MHDSLLYNTKPTLILRLLSKTLKYEQNKINLCLRDDSSLGALGGLSSHLLLVLGIAALSIFVLVVAGSRALGRVSLGLVCRC